MTAPPSLEEGQSTTRPPRFKGQFYGWWKTRMHDYIKAKDTKLWDLILDGPCILTKDVVDREHNKGFPKQVRNTMKRTIRRQRRTINKRSCWYVESIQMSTKKIFACDTTKEIWDCLKIAFEELTQIKGVYN